MIAPFLLGGCWFHVHYSPEIRDEPVFHTSAESTGFQLSGLTAGLLASGPPSAQNPSLCDRLPLLRSLERAGGRQASGQRAFPNQKSRLKNYLDDGPLPCFARPMDAAQLICPYLPASDFTSGIARDPYLAPLMPFRLELMNGAKLGEWLSRLAG